jgi:tRNA-specific 2-thiouridylase
LKLLGKPRYRDPSVPLHYRPLDSGKAEIIFDEPQRALTPGQVLALYDGERLIGGGTYCLSSLGRADQNLGVEVSA